MSWYVVFTTPASERVACRNLRRLGVRVYMPLVSTEVRHRRTKEAKMRFRPLMVGYLFVRFPSSMLDGGVPRFGDLRECHGVRGFITTMSSDGEACPVRLSAADVAIIMRRQRRREFGRAEVENLARKLAHLRKMFKPGRRVIIVDGPFNGHEAVLKRLRDETTLEVEIDLFGRPTKATVNVPEVRATEGLENAA